MTIQTPFPRLPAPPVEYDQRQQQDLIRSLEQTLAALRNPGEARHTELTLTGISTDPTDLEPGAVWNNGGLLGVAGTTPVSPLITGWEDIDFSITARTSNAGQPTPTTLQGNITAPQWDVNDWFVCEPQELIHSWKEGSEFQWHVHFVTNGEEAVDKYVRWEVEWFWANAQSPISATIITTSPDMLIAANTPTKTMRVAEIARATIPATIGGHLWARLRRVTSVGAAPVGDPWCSMLQVHIECDTIGSPEITSK